HTIFSSDWSSDVCSSDLEQVKRMGELGFLGMMTSEQYGGSGMDTVSYALVMEEISKIDASCSVIMSVNNSLVCWGLEKFGSEEQKQKYLIPLAKGELDRKSTRLNSSHVK